jgi:TRAP-type C4-dicarboxylate transport system permease small subunit
MEFFRKAEKVFDKTVSIMLLISGAIVLFDCAAVVQDVIIRKTTDFTWSPLYEILTYSLVWMTFLGTTAIYRDDGHVKLDSFMQLLPKRAQTLVHFITSCAVAVLCAFLLFLTARLTANDYQNHFVLATVLNPPKWPIEIIIPFNFVLLFIQAIRHSVRYFMAYRSEGLATPADKPAE